MPIYEYEHDAQSEAACRARFEVLQRLQDPPLAQCPDCGLPCHRVVSSFAMGKSTKHGVSGKADLSTKNLEKLGFTQYRRTKKGRYEKTCGQGPSVIRQS